MSHLETAASAAQRPAAAGAGQHGVSFPGVVRSEWIKFWSLRSTQILVLLTLIAMIGIGWLTALLRSLAYGSLLQDLRQSDGTISAADFDEHLSYGFNLYTLPTSGLQLGAMIIGSLAVLFMASEYATGMIRSSFAATPRRLPVFAAKALVLVVVSYLVGLVASFATFALANMVLGGMGLTLSLATPGVLPGLLLGGLYVAGVSVLGLSLATLLRNSAGAIMLLLGMFFILGFVGNLLLGIPGDFWRNVPQHLPGQAAGRMIEIGQIPGLLDPLPGGLVFLGWILLVMIPALILMKKRDA